MSIDASGSQTTWLTQEAYDRLREELAQMSGPGRVEIAKKIEAAREEGDLKENGGYHAAKEEQGKQEARIRQLEQLLRNAQVGSAAANPSGVAGPGMVLTVRFAGDEETETFLVGSREVGSSDLPVYSAQSPLGQAITGKKVGETATYTLPNGSTMSVELLKAEPYTA